MYEIRSHHIDVAFFDDESWAESKHVTTVQDLWEIPKAIDAEARLDLGSDYDDAMAALIHQGLGTSYICPAPDDTPHGHETSLAMMHPTNDETIYFIREAR